MKHSPEELIVEARRLRETWTVLDGLEALNEQGHLWVLAADLADVRDGLLWLGNNMHNYGTPEFKSYLEAAIQDARRTSSASEQREI